MPPTAAHENTLALGRLGLTIRVWDGNGQFLLNASQFNSPIADLFHSGTHDMAVQPDWATWLRASLTILQGSLGAAMRAGADILSRRNTCGSDKHVEKKVKQRRGYDSQAQDKKAGRVKMSPIWWPKLLGDSVQQQAPTIRR